MLLCNQEYVSSNLYYPHKKSGMTACFTTRASLGENRQITEAHWPAGVAKSECYWLSDTP